MPTYVYGCENGHEKEVVHPMNDDIRILCFECGLLMRRIPQPFRFYMNPGEVLLDYMDEGFSRYKRDRIKRKAYANKQRT